ncbi:hypothetical protein AFE02nite_28780 [Actinotalea fermentans]|uniref:Uncharacterized protein n=1 Tax=Actinotalea fermentans TaxID=43671 RepID=A0A511Z122_9CELL|nr:hypothetical protein AFE02nite_28780 [Actinotalea fermentans]
MRREPEGRGGLLAADGVVGRDDQAVELQACGIGERADAAHAPGEVVDRAVANPAAHRITALLDALTVPRSASNVEILHR